jgi:hypothetical protein
MTISSAAARTSSLGPYREDLDDPYGGWAADDELGWTFFLAESPGSCDGLDRDVRLSEEVAIAEARERVATRVREIRREGLVGFEDLSRGATTLAAAALPGGGGGPPRSSRRLDSPRPGTRDAMGRVMPR